MLKSVHPGIIGTLVGTGDPGCAGDGGPANAARLNEPKHVALDAAGHLYIADSENHLVRRVDARTGIITTIAGVRDPDAPVAGAAGHANPAGAAGHADPAGAAGPVGGGDAPDGDDPLADPAPAAWNTYAQQPDVSGMIRYVSGAPAPTPRCSGDGGPATDAALNFPSAVAVADDGTVYIADTRNHRVRRIDPRTGVIDTIAGTGRAAWSGDGGPAARAALNEPAALALGGREALFIADQSNHRVRKIDLASGVITTVAGTGESGYNGDGARGPDTALAGPSGLAVDGAGDVYVADTFNGRIRKWDRRTGLVDTVVGGAGPFHFRPGENETSTALARPSAIALHPDGRLFITDNDNHVIRVWHLRTRTMSLCAGTGTAGFDGDGGPPVRGSLNYPFGVALDAGGRVFIADTFNHRIRVIGGGAP